METTSLTPADRAAGGTAGLLGSGAAVATNTAGNAGTSGAGGTAGLAPVLPRPDQLDLLFMVDNSVSMGDKQEILRQALPDLMTRLVNPICLDAAGNERPAPPTGGECPAGQRRQFEPLSDVHVGIVSSSLGDGGANLVCPAQGLPMYRPDRVDLAHLMGSLERSTAVSNAQGFLEWRAGTTGLDDFTLNAQRMVSDVGESGCGLEASLESWYRFLIDPTPYRSLAHVPCSDAVDTGSDCVQPATGPSGEVLLDDTLLAQRAAFLRPQSLVAILMLSDENDCSLLVGERNWVPFTFSAAMSRGSTACDRDANAKCCYSCLAGPPAGCSSDPACSTDAGVSAVDPQTDGWNLRCFQQRRRYGQSFLYPTQRYVNALTQPQLCTSAPDLAASGCASSELRPNPLFQSGRPAQRVLLGGIIGVPWQALASEETARGQVLGASDVLRFRSNRELTEGGVWGEILGSPGVEWRAATASRPEVLPAPAVPPTLPQMIESTQFPRPGVAVGNAINGRDFDTTQGSFTADRLPEADDLQYACIFPLASPRDCAQAERGNSSCDCVAAGLNRPLCEQTPGVSAPGTLQYWSKAYPSSRQLAVLKDFGDITGNAIVASICARNVTDSSKPDFGYRPAVAALIERLQDQLAAP